MMKKEKMKSRGRKLIDFLKDEIKAMENTMCNFPETRQKLIKKLCILKKAQQILEERTND